ncbi:MAG: 50S ribosomal protein L25 [Firmicutes bacterium HGW-Firmicutes-7]|nr:MAG: 50S ribosomal protein L25 [Firmicutes bacterium HGW-Firmicutes-7]
MEEVVLEAIDRVKQTGKFREVGFVPGVLYGDIANATSVKFDASAIRKVITHHGSNAKVWIKYKDSKKYGFIKEVQLNPLSKTLTHIDVQIVSKDHEIKLQIPIVFNGEDELRHKELHLHAYRSDITVIGKMAIMPDIVTVDVSEMALGDTITFEMFHLDEHLSVEKEDEIYGAIVHLKKQVVDEGDETDTEVETEKSND